MKHFSATTAASMLPLDLWAPGTELLRGVPVETSRWLTETGLLTERIRLSSGAAHGLRVLDERLGFLNREQQALLRAPGNCCFVREVVLSARGRPWVFAQSLVPDHTLEAHPWLAELGETSLGATLDGFTELERGPFEFAPLPALHPLAARALELAREESDFVWARRSWFALRGRRLLVQEVFLPELGDC